MEYYLPHCFLISFILLVWLKTEAFYEYCKLLGFKKIFKIKEYSDFSAGPELLGLGLESAPSPTLTYLEYLKVEYDSFFVRLIGCPICLAIWLNIFICLILKDFSFFFVKLWTSLVLYFVLTALMKKSN